MTSYPHLQLIVPVAEAELATLELFEAGAVGVEERGEGTLNRPEGELASGFVQLSASFADAAEALAARTALAARWPAELREVLDDGWRDGWKAYFKPTRIGERLVVRPSWEPYTPSSTELVLTLDPGCAFGTGTHETTRLLLRGLDAQVTPGCRVLDVGTGSGILAIACLLLGAARVRAIDVDPDAVRVSEENAALNAVADRLEASVTPLSAIDERFPLVLANIETRVLVPEAAALTARVEPFGTLALSGILAPEEARVREAYANCELLSTERDGDWIALFLRVPSARAA